MNWNKGSREDNESLAGYRNLWTNLARVLPDFATLRGLRIKKGSQILAQMLSKTYPESWTKNTHWAQTLPLGLELNPLRNG